MGGLHQDGIAPCQQQGQGLEERLLRVKVAADKGGILGGGAPGRFPGKLSDQKEGVDPCVGRVAAHVVVEKLFIFAQLAHIAQDGDLAAQGAGKHIQRGGHGDGIGVVAVVQDLPFLRVNQVVAAADGQEAFDALPDLVRGQPQGEAHGCAGQGVIDHVAAGNRDMGLEGAGLCDKGAAGSVKPQIFDILRMEIKLRIQAEEQGSGGAGIP